MTSPAPESSTPKWRKWLAWALLSPFAVVFAPIWIPSYAFLWALNELGVFDDPYEAREQQAAQAQFGAAKSAAENSYKMLGTR